MKQKRIVTIQDLSCLGKCSLGVALPVISALGLEAVALPTAILSTHTGEFKNYTFYDLTSEMPKIGEHWKSLDVEFDAIYVGYLGSIHQLELVGEFIDNFAKKDTIVFIDPVMGDNGVLYNGFSMEFVEKMVNLCRRADVICPNITEACLLTGVDYIDGCFDKEYVDEILAKLSKICKNSVLTSVGYDNKTYGAIALNGGERIEVLRDKIEGHYYGAGDLFASTFIGKYTKDGDFLTALNLAADFVAESIKKTQDEAEKFWYGLKFEQALGMLTDCK